MNIERHNDLICYVNTNGFWFASNEEQEDDAKIACAYGFLQPAENLIGHDCTAKELNSVKHFYVRKSIKSREEWPVGLWNLVGWWGKKPV